MAQNKDHLIEPHLVRIPAGSFVIGANDRQVALLARRSSVARQWQVKGFFGREQPQHEVQLDRFSIARFPVSVTEFRHFLSEGAYRRQAYWGNAGWQWLERSGRTQPDQWDDPEWTADERLPVIGVNWFEARAYCRWLARRTGRPYRLPTEAEWEAAARGPEGQMYPWGETFDAGRCNCRDSELGRPVIPGRFSPAGDSPYGLADMVGNVSEWTASLFRPYPIGPGDGRDDPEAAGERVIRGGSWFSPAIRARATSRGMNDPDFSDNDVGFRVAAGPTPTVP
ncbi:MAG TPA: SUMF1/EgtB/PvdO family nonheme iron enzyme [Anaerolineae bacterium]|jgi:formylglycine-generating enzyme required for sulfatase activity|nr:SUMF1/EgtB/PvdO family nonheme iron enzyme [Anaerolineae bacterium]